MQVTEETMGQRGGMVVVVEAAKKTIQQAANGQ